jgi:hypothetical protein
MLIVQQGHMVSNETFRMLALSFPESEEHPHFHKTSFRIRNRIFATLDEKQSRAMVKLTAINQSVYCKIDPAVIFPVPGGWGKKGATYVELKNISKSLAREILSLAYSTVAPPALSKKDNR